MKKTYRIPPWWVLALAVLMVVFLIYKVVDANQPQPVRSVHGIAALSVVSDQDLIRGETVTKYTVPPGEYTLRQGSPVVSVNGVQVGTDFKVKTGDKIEIFHPAPTLIAVPLPPPKAKYPALPATEGSWFSVDGTVKVRYGREPNWYTKDITDDAKCDNATFGDSFIGVGKICEIAPATPPAAVYLPPLVISKGGTYSGSWESTDVKVAAVTVKTSEPVIIENCNLRGVGHLVNASWVSARITIRNCTGTGVVPNVAGRGVGRFLASEGSQSIVVENNTMDHTGGVYLNGMTPLPAPEPTVTIRYNLVKNIDGRLTESPGVYGDKVQYVQFLQFNKLKEIPRMEVAWNRVDNAPYNSRVEDNINLYASSGTVDSPLKIHHNLVFGAYGQVPQNVYSGGGILAGDAGGGQTEIFSNTVLETSNYGVAIAGGSNMVVRDNVVLGTGKLADGTILDGDPDAGIYIRDYSADKTHIANSIFLKGNRVGWGRPKPSNKDARWDYSISKDANNNPLAVLTPDNVKLPDGEVPRRALLDAVDAWVTSAAKANVRVGSLVAR